MSYKIRQAVLNDIPFISDELKKFSDCYSTKLPPFKDEETSKKVLENMIENHLFLVAVDESANALVGFIAGFVCDHIYNPDIKTLAEAFWWTQPEHRRSGAGVLLLEEYEAWGKENVDWILMTIEDDTPIDDQVLTHRGYRMKERSYILEVD